MATKPEPTVPEVTAPDREQATVDEVGDAGISMTTVLVMLVVLGVLVVGIFWALPAWYGSSVISVSPR